MLIRQHRTPDLPDSSREGIPAPRVIAALAAVLLLMTGLAHAHDLRRIDDACADGTSGLFTADGPSTTWYVHSGANKAYNNCHMYTSTIGATADVINYASYYLPVNSSQNGDYYLWAYVACEDVSNHWSTTDARYRRYRDGTSNPVTETYRISQKSIVANCSTTSTSTLLTATASTPPTYDHWNASNGGYTMLIDKSSDSGKYVSADMLEYSPRH